MEPLLELCEGLEAAADVAAAWRLTTASLARLGVAWCHHAYVAAPAQPLDRPASVIRLTSLPADWQVHHGRQRYWRVDASIRHCAHSLAPMATGLGFARAAGDEGWAGMCADAEAAGFGDGLALPLRGARGSLYGGMALITRERGAAFVAWRAARGRLALLTAQLAAQRLLLLAEAEDPVPLPRLSPRERECLLWLLAGLRNDRIAERLGLSRATVDLHLARARRRLGARTREQAIAKALTLGLLQP
jgi:DNA-binding CsgD family transcriptional regulator